MRFPHLEYRIAFVEGHRTGKHSHWRGDHRIVEGSENPPLGGVVMDVVLSVPALGIRAERVAGGQLF